MVALKRAVLKRHTGAAYNLLSAGVLGDGFGSFRDGVLGQLSGQKETDSSLDFATGDGRSLVVVGQTRRFGSDAFEDVVDEAVHDAHRLGRDASVRVDLFQHFVDVNGIALLPLALLLLVSFGNVLLRLSGLLGGFSTDFGRHSNCGGVRIGVVSGDGFPWAFM